MARALASLSITLFVTGAALLLGLAGASLRTGLLDPLDWLLPSTVAIILLAARSWRGQGVASSSSLGAQAPTADAAPAPAARRTAATPESPWAALAIIWAIVTLPPLVLLARAGTHVPAMGMALLAASLGIAAIVCALIQRRSSATRAITIVALVAAALVIPRLATPASDDIVAGQSTERPLVAILTAMPLQGVAMGAAHGLTAAESIGLRSPLWQALESHFRLRALDALDGDALAGLSTLLLAQPRSLTPQELVALDAWVRAGGRAIILADPLLHWPDPRPLAHPARAPLTSLLDPLLSHWGVRLEAAEIDPDGDPVERRPLTSGAMLQLAGSSRFTPLAGKSSCIMGEDGLLAHCRLGRGSALIIADADWIDDSLWTLTPDQPANRRGWTSDALDVLSAWLRGGEVEVSHFTSWIAGKEALVSALRGALLAGLLLALTIQLVMRRPRSFHEKAKENSDQGRSLDEITAEAP